MRSRFAASTKPRYCSASFRIEIRRRSTFCAPRQRQEQVERPLVAVDVDDQRLGRQPRLGALGVEEVLRHAPAPAARRTPPPAPPRRPPAPPAAAPAPPPRAPRRPRPAPAPPTTTSAISPGSPLQCSTTSQPAASARAARSAKPPVERLHRQVVGHQAGRRSRSPRASAAPPPATAWPAPPGRARHRPRAPVIAIGRSASARNGAKSAASAARSARRPPAARGGCRAPPAPGPACASSPAARRRPAAPRPPPARSPPPRRDRSP